MRLTQYMREAYVRAVMNDVPKVNYEDKIRTLVHEDAVNQLVPAVRKVYKDPETKSFICQGTVFTFGVSVSIPSNSSRWQASSYTPSTPAIQEQLEAFKAAKDAQDTRNKELQSKLKSVASSCNTRKQLAEMLPEFEKYLPVVPNKDTYPLPAISNMVGDFIRAGWPKDKAEQKAKEAQEAKDSPKDSESPFIIAA